MLRTLLESHPALVCQSEVFNSDDPDLPYPLTLGTAEILDRWVYGDRGDHCQAAGFVLQIYHPRGLKAFPGIRENPAWDNIWELLEEMADLRVIHLRRENGLARHLSHILARRTGRWHQWNPEKLHQVTHLHKPGPTDQLDSEIPEITLEPERLLLDFEEVEKLHLAVEERFSAGNYFPLSYEQLCHDPKTFGLSLLRFLDLEPAPLEPAVTKLETRPLSQRISNFEELKRGFKNTTWARYFDAEPV